VQSGTTDLTTKTKIEASANSRLFKVSVGNYYLYSPLKYSKSSRKSIKPPTPYNLSPLSFQSSPFLSWPSRYSLAQPTMEGASFNVHPPPVISKYSSQWNVRLTPVAHALLASPSSPSTSAFVTFSVSPETTSTPVSNRHRYSIKEYLDNCTLHIVCTYLIIGRKDR